MCGEAGEVWIERKEGEILSIGSMRDSEIQFKKCTVQKAKTFYYLSLGLAELCSSKRHLKREMSLNNLTGLNKTGEVIS